MASIIAPFRGIRYRAGGRRDLSALIAPPYDVISPALREELEGRDPHNIVRLELPAPCPDDEDGYGRYRRAAGLLRQWLAEEVLVRDPEPTLYVLEQGFELHGQRWRRRGLFALVRLPELGKHLVLSHEGTLAEPKADRLHLLQACQTMLSPILVLAEDQDGALLDSLQGIRGEAEAVAEDGGVNHRLWVVREPAAADAFLAAVGDGPLYIADGHHRFETALTHREEMRRRFPDAPPSAGFNHALALIASGLDQALKILPTHRLVSGLPVAAAAELRARMEECFDIHRWPLPNPEDLGDQPWLEGAADGRHVYGAYCGDGFYCVLRAREELVPPSASVVAGLDVSVLHRCLLDPVLEAAGPSARVDYVVDGQQAARAVAQGQCQFAFFLRPTRVAEVMAAARTGERMPGKSTYFHPKAPAGLVLSDASPEPI